MTCTCALEQKVCGQLLVWLIGVNNTKSSIFSSLGHYRLISSQAKPVFLQPVLDSTGA
jgi:hypothetical protein